MASSPKLKDAPAKLKSKVWEYYGFRECSDNRATCKMCFTDVSYPKAGSTTNLHQHLKRKHSLDVFESKSVMKSQCGKSSTKPISGQMKLADLNL